MKKILKKITPLMATLLISSFVSYSSTALAKTISPDITLLSQKDGFSIFNRDLTAFQEQGYKSVRLTEKEGEGIAYLKGIHFTSGEIEFDVRGKDIPQQSFLGIAFHGTDGKNYDAIYFRPFNFKAPNAEKRSHSVQYISHPEFTWQKLREEHTGIYENSINPVVDPNKWFHVRVLVSKELIQVFVNNSKEPSLQVKPLNNRTGGLVGFWTGNGSGGDFANLKITSDKL